MKKNVEVEHYFCDVCKKDCGPYLHYKCLRCEKTFCYDCMKNNATEYKHGVHFSGSGDGLYCNECNLILYANGDELHGAYLKIAQLRSEEEGWWLNFKKRVEKAEGELKTILNRKNRK